MPHAAAHQRSETSPRPQPASGDLLPALAMVLAAWSLLATQGLLAPLAGRPAAVFVSFLAVSVLVIAARRGAAADRPLPVAGALALAGALTGFASFPVWITAIGSIGIAIGLPARPLPARLAEPMLIAATVVLAPIFEELLYRERVLLALRPRIGAAAALALSSVLFALPHLELWPVFATFVVGLALGALMLAGGSVALCIGLHAGLNLAALVCGIPPGRLALPLGPALAATALLFPLSLLAARRTARREAPLD
jgi:membrane protease YdiL (CAAX protease family)